MQNIYDKIRADFQSILDGYIKTHARLNKTVPSNLINELNSVVNGFKKSNFYKHLMNSYQRGINSAFKREYNKYLKTLEKEDINIKPIDISSLKPTIKKELERRQKDSLSLIKTQTDETLFDIKRKILGWSTEIQTKVKPEEWQYNFWVSVPIKHMKYQTQDHNDLIIRDQRAKMLSNFDYITAEEIGALGFYWKTREDNRVVGDPTGLYPKGNKMHNNHYVREGVFFILRDNWAMKKGYMKKVANIEYIDEIPDGLPANAINCRCIAEYKYYLDEIPLELLTNKGKEYIA